MDGKEFNTACDKAFEDEVLAVSDGYSYSKWIFDKGVLAAYKILSPPTAGEIRYSLRASELSDKLDQARAALKGIHTCFKDDGNWKSMVSVIEDILIDISENGPDWAKEAREREYESISVVSSEDDNG